MTRGFTKSLLHGRSLDLADHPRTRTRSLVAGAWPRYHICSTQGHAMPRHEADLAPAIPRRQCQLDLSDLEERDRQELAQNLSALALGQGQLWLGGDEGRSLVRLRQLGDGRWGEARRHRLRDHGLADGRTHGESDIEGLALDGDRLWLVGSHSRRRRKASSGDAEALTVPEESRRNAHVLGCLRLDGQGEPCGGQRLEVDQDQGRDALSQALARDPLIRPFLKIPSKDNGLDIEGICARGDRLLVGLRGPVLRGMAVVLDLRLDGLETGAPTGSGQGRPLRLASLRLRILDLAGLGVRDLAAIPAGDDVMLLAGPTLELAGPCYLYRWRQAWSSGEPQGDDLGQELQVERPEPLLWLRDAVPGRPGEGSDKPEGLELQPEGEQLLAWIAYDSPRRLRLQEGGRGTQLDGFEVEG